MEQMDAAATARELFSAYQAGGIVPMPSSSHPGLSLEMAYEVETMLKGFREAGGARSIGRKVGYANKAMWRKYKLDTLVWAHMYDDTVHYSDSNVSALSLARYRALKIEPEIVFGLKQAIVARGIDPAGALAATEWLAMGFEIIYCPYPDWKFLPADFVASFGLHAALVIGERIPVLPELIPTLLEQLPKFTVHISKNGKLVGEGSGRNSLASPASCLAELGGAIVKRFPGEPLSAGEVISSGTLTTGHAIDPGELWMVEIEGLPLPSLTLRLE